MISTWNQFPLDVPVDGQLIWARIDRWAGAPFAGRYSSALATITSLINGITYPVWMISAWRPSDPPIGLPAYPIGPIRLPDSSSAISAYATNTLNFRLQWSKLPPDQNADDYIIYYAIAYRLASLGNPPISAFPQPKWFQCGNAISPARFWMAGQDTGIIQRFDVQNWIPLASRIVTPGFRMFVRYQLQHKPTGYIWPAIIESVAVT